MPDSDRTPTGGAEASDTRQRLVETAERLFAERGLDGVSLRQISAAAGLYNNFAVQYHFGSREGLIDAILAHRLVRIDAKRSRLLTEATAAVGRPSVRVLLDVLLRPLADEALASDSWYVSFIVRTRLQQLGDQPWAVSARGPLAGTPGVTVADLITEQLTELPAGLRQVRFQAAIYGCLFTLAAFEHRGVPAVQSPASPDTGDLAVPFEAFVVDLLDTAAASLLAPLSPAAREALRPACQ